MTALRTCAKCKDNTKPIEQSGTWGLYICESCRGNYEMAWFAIADQPAIQMLHDPTNLWNGWNNPQFTLEQAQLFVDWTNAPEQKETWASDMPEKFYFRDDRLFSTWLDEDETNEQEIHPHEINGTMYYGIGNWSWCWQACETENEANEIWD